jgi:hypothetical protein
MRDDGQEIMLFLIHYLVPFIFVTIAVDYGLSWTSLLS